MPLIEGIGDEVLQFLVMTLLIGMTLAAWMSTNARPNRYRTLLVMRSQTPHPVTVSIRSGAPNILYTHAGGRGSADTVTLTTSPRPDINVLESGPIIPLQEMDSIVDADMALFENNRLHFYRRVEQSNTSEESTEDRESQEEAEPASNAQIQEMDSIVNAMEADMNTDARPQESPTPTQLIERVTVTEIKDEESTEENASAVATDASTEAEQEQQETEHEREKKKILIKLKYLNDTLKEVEGSLDESLQDFKWRVFSRELSWGRRVLLIHGGRVLGDERASLRQLGLTHRAVVHALVQPPQGSAPGPAPGPAPPHSAPAPAPPPDPRRLWDLENILMTLVSVALTVVWFFRCEYSNMFTASASVALFGLTVFYSVAIFGLYLSDTFQLDRRPQPVTNN